jgi:hypothetical protein
MHIFSLLTFLRAHEGRVSTRVQLFILRRLCRSRETEFGNYIITLVLQDKVS